MRPSGGEFCSVYGMPAYSSARRTYSPRPGMPGHCVQHASQTCGDIWDGRVRDGNARSRGRSPRWAASSRGGSSSWCVSGPERVGCVGRSESLHKTQGVGSKWTSKSLGLGRC